MNSTYVLKEPAAEASATSCGDNTRRPLFNSVKKLREFWTRWQSRENKVLTGNLNDPGSLSDDPGSFPGAVSHRQAPARARVPWRSEEEAAARPWRGDRCLVADVFATSPENIEEYSMRDPFLRDEGPSEFSCHAFSSVFSHHSVTESTIEAYADVSLEMAHRLRSRRAPRSQHCNSVLPSNLFRRSSLETRRSSYRRLRSISAEDDEAP
ncbi:hypothetical protein MRX96_035692 [Rhipicephalus microplus]